MKISINDINSAGITAQAKIDGITEVTLLGTHDHPDHPGSNDWRIRIYDFGGVKVADTNGDPVWEENCPNTWLELMKNYEVIPRHYQIYCDRGNGLTLDGCWGSENANFHNLSDAKDAVKHLEENYPDCTWTIVEE
jgi:hypothetical protein